MAAPNLAWGGHKNGQIPRTSLVDLGGGKLAQPDAARAFQRLAAAFRTRWGTRLYIGADQDVYRDLARQQYMLDHPELYPHAKAAAGTSIHGWARSFDVSGYGKTSHVWLVENAPQYGISWAYGRELGESWHWDYVGPITTTAGGGGSFASIERHPDMYLLRTLDGAVALVTANGLVNIASLEHLDLFSRLFKAYPAWETFNSDQRAVIAGYIQAANTADDAETAKILDALSRVVLDPAPIVAAVAAEIAKQGVSVDLAPVEAAIAAGFASVNANIDDQPTEFKITPA